MDFYRRCFIPRFESPLVTLLSLFYRAVAGERTTSQSVVCQQFQNFSYKICKQKPTNGHFFNIYVKIKNKFKIFDESI